MKVLVFSFLFAAAAALPLNAQGTPQDDKLYDQVLVKLAENRDVGAQGRIKLQVKDGEVTLDGLVESEKQREKAAKVAKKVKGVKQVVNNLKVDPRQ